MKARDLYNVISSVKKPIVNLTGRLLEDSFGSAGMIARIVNCYKTHDNFVHFHFDYNEHRDHNIALDEPTWYISKSEGNMGTAIEAGIVNPNDIFEDICFDLDEEINVVFTDDCPTLKGFLESEFDGTYLEWLESMVTSIITNKDAQKNQG